MEGIKILFSVALTTLVLAGGVNAQSTLSDFLYVRNIIIENTGSVNQLTINMTANITLDTQTLINNNKMMANGDDLIVAYNGSQIDRINLTPFNTQNTIIAFRLMAPIPPGVTDAGNYSLYYGNTSAVTVMNNASNVLRFYETFDNYTQGPLEGRGGWRLISGASGFNVSDSSVPQFPKQPYQGSLMITINDTGTDKEIIREIPATKNVRFIGYIAKNTTSSNGGITNLILYNGTNMIVRVSNVITAGNIGFQDALGSQVLGAFVQADWIRFIVDVNNNGKMNITAEDAETDTVIGTSLNRDTINGMGDGINNISMRFTDQFGVSDSSFIDYLTLRDYINGLMKVTVGAENNNAYFVQCGTDIASTVNVLNFAVSDEDNKTVAVLSDWTAAISVRNTTGSIRNSTITVTNASILSICTFVTNTSLTADGIIKYVNGTEETTQYTTRYYFLQNMIVDSTPDNISLYLLKNSDANQIRFIVEDSYKNPQQDTIVKATRFFIGEGVYRQVDQGLTDFNGETIMNLKLNEWYIFIVEQNGVILRTFPQTFLTSTSDITLQTTAGTNVGFFEYSDSVGATCTASQITELLTCTFSDTSGKMVNLNLTIQRRPLVGNWVTVCANTTTSSSGTISCSYTGYNTTDLTYYLTGSFCCSSTTFFNLVTGTIAGATASSYGTVGIVAVVFILIAAIMFGYWNPVVPIIMGLFGIMIGVLMSMIVVSWMSFVSLIVAGGILVWKMRT